MTGKRDSFDALTRIPVKVIEGKIVGYFDNAQTFEIADGTRCELVVKSSAITNPSTREKLNQHKIVDFLPKGTTLYARIRTINVPTELWRNVIPFSSDHKTGLVEFVLQDDLKLELRGTKPATLLASECLVPALVAGDDRKGIRKSVNETCSFIATKFESKRRSNTGNGFDVAFVRAQGGGWVPLRHLRDEMQVKFEQELFT